MSGRKAAFIGGNVSLPPDFAAGSFPGFCGSCRPGSRTAGTSYGRMTGDPEASAVICSRTSGAVVNSPSRFGLPVPW